MAIPDNPRDEELKALAQNLLGVDFSAQVPPIDLDDDDLFAAPVAEEPEAAGAVRADERDDFGAEAAFEDAATQADDAWAGDADDDFGSGLDSPTTESNVPADATPAAAKDPYWDALEGFDWDEGSDESAAKARTPGRRPDVDRDRRSDRPPRDRDERPAPPVSPRPRDEFIEDDAFGEGLLDEVSRAPAPRPQEPPQESPRGGDQGRRGGGGRDRERDGGRRGRGRGRDRRDEGRRDEGRRGGRDDDRRGRRDEERSRRPPEDLPAPSAARPAEFPDDDEAPDSAVDATAEGPSDFGAGLEVDEPPRPAESRGRSRRGRRGRGEYRERERTPTEPPADSDADESDFDAAEAAPLSATGDSTDQEVPPPPRHSDVPTWEEAISYLVKPARREERPSWRESSSGGDSRGRESEGGGRGGGGRGGRGRGGRGRGHGRDNR
jgi:hypothetical protein